MLRGETILLGTARTEGATDRARRAARGGAARASRSGMPGRIAGRGVPPAPHARSRGWTAVSRHSPVPVPRKGRIPNAPHGKRSPPALGRAGAYEAPGDRRPPSIDYRGVMWTSESWTLRSLHRPGLCGKKPRAKIHCRPSRGVSTHSAGQRHRTPSCRCRLPAIHPQRVETKPNCKFAPKSSRAIPASRPPKVHSYGCRHRQRTLTELANTPVASVEMITSRHAHVGITRPTSTSRTILTPMKTRSSATACCRYWNDLISPTTNV